MRNSREMMDFALARMVGVSLESSSDGDNRSLFGLMKMLIQSASGDTLEDCRKPLAAVLNMRVGHPHAPKPEKFGGSKLLLLHQAIKAMFGTSKEMFSDRRFAGYNRGRLLEYLEMCRRIFIAQYVPAPKSDDKGDKEAETKCETAMERALCLEQENDEEFKTILNLEFSFEKICDDDKECSVRTIEDFLKKIYQFVDKNEDKYEYAFRGSSKVSHEFEPSVFREGKILREKDYYHHVIRLAPEEFSTINAFDILCKMQHYQIPTRLLDLTSNPLVALWFACKASQESGKVEVVKGQFYQSDIHEIQIICLIGDFLSRYYDDKIDIDKVAPSMIFFRDYLMKKNIWCADVDYERYLTAVLRLNCVGIRPNYSNPRLKAQQGLFILFGNGCEPYDPSDEGKMRFPIQDKGPIANTNNIQTIEIPAEAKTNLRTQLRQIGIDESRLFPELEHISEYVKNTLVKSN